MFADYLENPGQFASPGGIGGPGDIGSTEALDMTVTDFLYLMRIRGWAHFPSVLSADFVQKLGQDLETAYCRCREIQVSRGLDSGTYGTAHHIVGDRNSLDELLVRQTLHEPISAFLAGPYILNSYGGVLNRAGQASYVGNIHRDIRTFLPGSPLMLNMLVMLDDFTAENGATYVLSGSNHLPDRPTDEFFRQYADRFLGRAGDIVLFDSNVWHAAGLNSSAHPRRALTLTFTRPFMKPQLDYPRYLAADYIKELDDHMRQLLGFNSRIPTDLDGWYQPIESRYYKPGQG